VSSPNEPHGPLARFEHQVPGMHRFNLGSFQITAILDAHTTLRRETLISYDGKQAQEALGKLFRPLPTDGFVIPVHCFVINTGEKLVLIDTGGGEGFSSSPYSLHDNLNRAGFKADDIDVIILTHLHGDHFGGLTTKTGEARFPNAIVKLHRLEYDFWHDDSEKEKASDTPYGSNFDAARSAIAPYAKQAELLEEDGELVPGIETILLPGHTPGHMGVMLRSDGQEVLMWADLVHHTVLQLVNPDWSMAFDTDPDLSRQTRNKILDKVSSEGIAVLGSHLDFPGFGHVAKEGKGYRFYPVPWQYTL